VICLELYNKTSFLFLHVCEKMCLQNTKNVRKRFLWTFYYYYHYYGLPTHCPTIREQTMIFYINGGLTRLWNGGGRWDGGRGQRTPRRLRTCGVCTGGNRRTLGHGPPLVEMQVLQPPPKIPLFSAQVIFVYRVLPLLWFQILKQDQGGNDIITCFNLRSAGRPPLKWEDPLVKVGRRTWKIDAQDRELGSYCDLHQWRKRGSINETTVNWDLCLYGSNFVTLSHF
jgi:hypothetical protein